MAMPSTSPPTPLHFLLLLFSGWVNRRQHQVIDYLIEENRVLREQLGGRRLRLTDDQRRRLAVKGKLLGRKLLGEVAGIVTPDTILGWYRKLVARKYDGTTKRSSGRPRTAEDIVGLVVRMAGENPGWGYTRIRDALRHLGHEVGRNTIKRILADHGVLPAPERRRTTSWKAFIKAHLGEIAAADFFSVEVVTLTGLVRYFVLFVIDIKTRRVEIAGIAHQMHGEWMVQVARNLTDAEEGFLRGVRYLILDRDPLYTAAFRKTLKVPLGEGHLRRAIGEFVSHYHGERHHQGLGGALVAAADELAGQTVKCGAGSGSAACSTSTTGTRPDSRVLGSWVGVMSAGVEGPRCGLDRGKDLETGLLGRVGRVRGSYGRTARSCGERVIPPLALAWRGG